MSLRALIIVYVIGGLTFIPLVLLSGLAFAYFTLPRMRKDEAGTSQSQPKELDDSFSAGRSEDDGFVDKNSLEQGSGTDAAGYFAVCREYVPGGINGKPPERSSPAGEILTAESPSVYQSMYRSIFDRNKIPAHSTESDKKDAKTVKRPRNVFFVVLRHEHLLLFDNSDQLEVRHVISLLHHDVDVYGGNEQLVEGDLWIKKNCIRLSRRTLAGQLGSVSQPFYIFSDNCSEKEDFYHALLLAQTKARENDAPPEPRVFDTEHMIKLVKALHTSEADPHCRWINALIGRVFLGLYRTEDVPEMIKAKIDRKISRVPKPNFISSIQVQSVDMGDAAPVLSNMKLKELAVDGSFMLETDIKYSGGVRLQIAAVARIELGSRIRAREVDLILAGVLRKLSGHLLVKIKPPPSNRLWISFETPPHMDIAVEPVVSTMQITYGVILRAIESRIREVVAETLVLPNWDDIPFFDTADHQVRGGIFNDARKADQISEARRATSHAIFDEITDEKVQSQTQGANLVDIDDIPPLSSKALSMPSLITNPGKEAVSRAPHRRKVATITDTGASSGISTATIASSPPKSKPSSPSMAPIDRPKSMRTNSFASAAIPVVSTEDATILAHRSSVRGQKGHKDATEYVKGVKHRSDSISAQKQPSSPSLEPSRANSVEEQPLDQYTEDPQNPATTSHERRRASGSMPSSPLPSATFPIADSPGARRWALPSTATSAALERATATARNWGVNMINRQAANRKSVSGFTSLAKEAGIEEDHDGTTGDGSSTPLSSSAPTTNFHTKNGSESKALEAQSKAKVAMGRGQPLPPVGCPLPGPKASLWANSPLNIASLKRKPPGTGSIASEGSSTPASPVSFHSNQPSAVDSSNTSSVPHRRRGSRYLREEDTHDTLGPELVVVTAPAEDFDSTDDEHFKPAGEYDLPPQLPPRPGASLPPIRQHVAPLKTQAGTPETLTGTLDTGTADAESPLDHQYEPVAMLSHGERPDKGPHADSSLVTQQSP